MSDESATTGFWRKYKYVYVSCAMSVRTRISKKYPSNDDQYRFTPGRNSRSVVLPSSIVFFTMVKNPAPNTATVRRKMKSWRMNT